METANVPLNKTFLPALLQCFGIIFLGYILGKLGILRQKEAKGISAFVQYLALPALIFVRISTISFQDVKWEFIASVFVSKTIVFICVALMTMLLTHPANVGKAGIYAIATTQSNDFALAYPMFLSVYGNSHPDYADYLYIIAPVQLLVLNTIGFFIMEMQTHKLGDDNASCHILKVIKSTLKNPIVFVTIIGIIWNVSFNHEIQPIFKATLQTLSDAFPATALFLVGHTMATKSQKSDNHIPITVALLIISKNLILPILLQKVSTFMLRGSNEDEIKSFSSFGFFYGTTPTAPSTYVFAAQYDISLDVITKTIIGSTLISAPLMFASASVISLTEMGMENISFYLASTIKYLSSASMIFCSWLLLFYIIGKKFQNISFGITLYIIFSQLLTSVGGIMLFFTIPPYSHLFYAQYILTIGGIFSLRISTLFLALLLIVIRWRSLCFILQARKLINIISISCVLLPCFVASSILFAKNIKPDGPNCQLGYVQIIATFTITVICFTGTILCLILQHVCFRIKPMESARSIEAHFSETCNEDEPILPQASINAKKIASSVIVPDEDICVDVEDLDKHFENSLTSSDNIFHDDIQGSLCDSRYHCSMEKRLQCATRVSTYKKIEKCGLYDDKEIFQHTFLLISLSVSMTVSLAVCFWKLILEDVNGIFIELEFVDVIMNYSLGILFFIIFGFDKSVLFMMLMKWKLLWYGNKKSQSSSMETCQNFVKKHERKFKLEIENFKTSYCSEYHNLFCSSDLIKWLMKNGEAEDVSEAEVYISNLLEGGVIEKVDKCEFFPDDASIFKMTNGNDII